MFVCVLTCDSCGYESEPFNEGYSLTSDSYTIIIKNLTTGSARIVKLKDCEIPSAMESDVDIESIVLKDNEEVIRTQFGVGELISANCPNCQSSVLNKNIIGMD
ncbi:hypothetical protein Mal48_04640 [Thalassoglobus polymorphus]|uniref:Uncharacterized protein n=1 Tax=Thalassoglobus polymorphus TaxID=2527994 RepID=A0A517QHX4_9PLAN|nr:hypothetical protein Mal48_04640 [Thalassoglobus polymorphus]